MERNGISIRLKRVVVEEIHVMVEVDAQVMKPAPEADGSFRLDTTKLFARAVEVGQRTGEGWRLEGVLSVQVHEIQTPPPGATGGA